MKKLYKILTLLSVFFLGSYQYGFAQPAIVPFSYTGSIQTYTVPAGIDSVTIAVTGADGGQNSKESSFSDRPGFGGCATATFLVSSGQILYIYTGGKGADGVEPGGAIAVGGFNGGGNAGFVPGSHAGGGGGGASDVRWGGSALANRKIVAGGGGGAGIACGGNQERGGDGGAFTGETGDGPGVICGTISPGSGGGGGNTTSATGGAAGTCSSCGGLAAAAGTSGAGGNAGSGSPGGGGGGGYFGGGGGKYTGGGGGSNYFDVSVVGTPVGTQGCNTFPGTYSGNGFVSILPKCAQATVTATSSAVCSGGTLTVSDNLPGGGGTWSSSDNTIATVDVSGIVTGVYPNGGTAIITYNVGPCIQTTTVTINPAPAVMTNMSGGDLSICLGLVASLSDSTSGGTWTSSNSTVATVVTLPSGEGDVSGGSVGTTTLTYMLPTGCFRTATFTVNPLPNAITGLTTVCAGLTTTLSDATPLGGWSSSNTNISTVDASLGTVTGVSAGIDTIIYTITATGCIATASYVVNPLPAAITGTMILCQGTSAALTDGTSLGTWSSSSTTVSVDASGNILASVVGGTVQGSATITYTISSTGCIATAVVTVDPNPIKFTISPNATVHYCAGGAGVDISLPSSQSGITYDLYYGAPIIVTKTGTGSAIDFGFQTGSGTYTIIATDATLPTNCQSTMNGITNIVIDTLPTVLPLVSVCAGSSITISDGGGGTWSSSNPPVATINSISGFLSGVPSTQGTSTITYTLPIAPGATVGCITTTTVTVNPNYPIYGTTVTCLGSTIALSDTSDAGAGSWTALTGGFGVVGSGTTASVTGTSGVGFISYTTAAGCTSTISVAFNPLAPITGPDSLCLGATITLSNANAGGTWSPSNVLVTPIDAFGTIIGNSATINGGVDTITYTLGSGCASTKVITVNPLPAPITGTDSVCVGVGTSVFETTGGGTWSTTSGNTKANIDLFGNVSGLVSGKDTIVYTLSTGCLAIYPFTVNPTPLAISGATSFCCGSSIGLSDATGPGTWISLTPTIVAIGSASGLVTCVSPGTGSIQYTSLKGCTISTAVTVNPLPAPIIITGRDTICPGQTIAMSDAGGGTWFSTNTTLATISGTGVVTANFGSGGVDTIVYTLPTGCLITATVLVRPLFPISPTGSLSLCVGSTIGLSTLIIGGVWSSGTTSIATVNPITGVVTGVLAGSVIITDTFSSIGCAVKTLPITVNPLPAVITGPGSVCANSSITLSDASGVGSWSTTSANATVNLVTGLVTGNNPGGTAVITYTLPGTSCAREDTITVFPLPPIASPTGVFTLCSYDSVVLSDASTGGTWFSTNTGVATIGSSDGKVHGVASGTTTISYTTIAGCVTTQTMTVNIVGVISGTFHVCVGSSTTLVDAPGGGTWASSNGNVSIGPSSSIATGVSSSPPLYGSIITYTSPAGCFATAFMKVDTLPLPITGVFEICQGTTTTLSDASPPAASGTWTSTFPGIGSISSTTGVLGGVTVGLTAGTTTITYTFTLTGCFITQSVTIDPFGTITGPLSTCIGLSTTLTDAVVGGGTWLASNTNVTITTGAGGVAIVTGNVAGTSTITFTSSKGCTTTAVVTVVPLPTAILGTFVACQGLNVQLSDAVPGGTWSSSDGSTVFITPGPLPPDGLYTGLKGGTSTITYTAGSSCYVVQTVTINPVTPIISPPFQVCYGSVLVLSDATGGGTWASSNTSVATVDLFGGVNPVSPLGGTSTITYTLGTGCSTTQVVTVNPLPAAITGTDSVCVGSQVSLTDITGGGTWSREVLVPNVANVNASGVVTGVNGGLDNITYTITATGCYVTYAVSVNTLPQNILGITSICLGGSTTLSDATSGGTWTSSNGIVAGIGSASGAITTGSSLGTSTISYTLTSTGCAVSEVFTVSPNPSAITGPTTEICVGSTVALTDPLGGGTWSSSASGIASVGTSSGLVLGISGFGTATITYTTPPGCSALYTMTVLPQPPAIITPLGDTNICPGSFVALTANTGILLSYQWYTSPGFVVITGATASSYIASPATNTKYQVTVTAGTTGCSATSSPMLVSVIPTTASVSITAGFTPSCAGSPLVLTATGLAATGYQWESSGTPISGATASFYTPTVTGTYAAVVTNATGCSATASALSITVNPSPAGTLHVIGSKSLCSGDSVLFTGDTVAGYSYQWFNGAAIAGATNVAYIAKAVGTYKLTETNGFGCSATTGSATVTINPVPGGATTLISGSLVFCSGGAVTLRGISSDPAASTYTYQWYDNGIPLAGATGSTLFVSASGIYKALITNPATGCGSFTAPPDTATLIATPVVAPLTSANFCWGGSSTLAVTVLGGASVKYLWSRNTIPIAGATNNTYSATITGTYGVTVTAVIGGCSVISTLIPVYENPLPDPLITFNGTNFHTQDTFLKYQWYKDLKLLPGATTSTTPAIGNGNYKVEVTDTVGCQSFSDIFVLTGWSPGHGAAGTQTVNGNGVIRIYPNPAQTVVHIESANEVRAIVTSVDGKVLIEKPAAKDIDINSLPDGIYTIMLYDVNGQMVKADKLVKATN